jgi:predicted RNA-binding protein
MCEAAAFMMRDGKEELILDSVDLLEPDNGNIRLVNIFGEQKIISAKIKQLSLVNHKIILEKID